MHRTGAYAALTGALLACRAASPAPAASAPAHGPAHPTTAGWHRLHPALCHTVGDLEPLP